MRILGIETSCDETAAAVVEGGNAVLASVVASQVESHAAYGGVVPELAAREHTRAIDRVVSEALDQARTALSSVDAVAVVNEPGLVPALLVGVSYAKGLAASLGVPLVPVDHMVAHVYAAFLGGADVLNDPATYPIIALVVSGGHTLLLEIDESGRLSVLGQTLDDAAGEAFDKAAKILELGYPGGPIIDRLAKSGNPAAVHFPRALGGGQGRAPKPENRFNFSYSGVKTALLYHVKDRRLRDAEIADIAASYQKAVVDVLVDKTVDACRHRRAATAVVCGGVACNAYLRESVESALRGIGVPCRIAPRKYCVDNAAMTAGLAWHYAPSSPSGAALDAPVRARFRIDRPPLRFAPNRASECAPLTP